MFNLNESGLNTSPFAKSQNVTVTEQTPTVINLQGTDPEDNNLTYSITEKPQYGRVILDGSSATYTSFYDAVYSDSFYFNVNDGTLDGDSPAKVSITIDGVNDSPISNNISSATIVNTNVIIPLVAKDPDYDDIKYRITKLP